MYQPGNQLRAFASGWCCRETMERVIDPLIADLQREHQEAVRRVHVWRGRWIRFAGCIAFLKVIALCAWTELTVLDRWTRDDRNSLTRAVVIVAATAVVVTALLVSRSAEDYPTVLVHPSPTRLLFLVPYPLVAGIALGATLGVALGLGGRALSRRLVAAAVGLSLICSAIVFIDVGWVAPAAHIAYRMTVGDTDPTPEIGEASLGALRRKIEQVNRDSAFRPNGFWGALSFDYHRRVALSFSPVLFTLFALAMAGCFRRRWVLGILGCATFLVYTWLVIVVRPWDLNVQPYVAAWLPNAAIATLTAVPGILIGLKPSRSV
jgi:lipopolysaccharide export system permease LptF/LptG-like protein